MLFPKSKMRLIDSYEGQDSETGWLELNVMAVDTDGVSKLVINLDDLEDLRRHRSAQSDALNDAKKLLGGG